ncbi:MAG TPA: membrane dipeptidase [Caulobacteraceae bacterium]
MKCDVSPPENSPKSDRRAFLKTAGLGVASLAAARATAAVQPARKRRLIINTLGGLADYNDPGEGRMAIFLRPSPRVIADARASGVTAMNITIGYTSGPGDPFATTVDDLAAADELIRTHHDVLVKVWTAEDILRAQRERKVGIIYGFQNCAMLDDKAERVDLFADLGVRIFQLTYNNTNALGGGSRAETDGLTPFGGQVISAINRRRAIVDLSHGSQALAFDAIRASSQPIAITHTGCRSLKNIPRNASDALLRAVAQSGGYVGIFTGGMFLTASGVSTVDDVVNHIDHAIGVCGEDHVGLGTDNPISGIDHFDAWRAMWDQAAVARAKAGVGAAGEVGGLPLTQDLLGPGQFDLLSQRMAKRGYSAARIDKVLGLNFLRYAQTIWGA